MPVHALRERGISALVDPTGTVVAATGVLTRENVRGTVRLRDDTTLYGRLGDWPGWLALLAIALTAAAARRGTRSRPGST